MRFAHLPLRNLVRRPLRSTLTAAGVAMATACLVAMLGVSHSLERGWVTALTERGTHILASRKDTAEVLAGALPVELGPRMARVEGVRSVCPELVELVSLESRQTVFMAGWERAGRLWDTLRLTEGRLPRREEGRAVVVGHFAAEMLKLRPGGALTFRGQSFPVVGVFRQDGAMGNSTVVMPLEAMQQVTGMEGRATLFSIQVDHPDDPARMERVLGRLAAGFPELTFWQTKDVGDNSELLRLIRGISWGISTIAMVMGALAVLNTLLMSVTERTHELGVLAAIGWSGRRVLSMLVLEGLALSTIGSLVGTGLGLLTLRVISQGPRLRGLIDADVPASLLLSAAGLMALLGTLAGLYPGWRAVRLNTLDAIRHE